MPPPPFGFMRGPLWLKIRGLLPAHPSFPGPEPHTNFLLASYLSPMSTFVRMAWLSCPCPVKPQVVVLGEEGEVLQQGRPDDLLQSGGAFADLLADQGFPVEQAVEQAGQQAGQQQAPGLQAGHPADAQEEL